MSRHHRESADAGTACLAGAILGMEQNNNTHHLLAGTMLYHTPDTYLRFAIDQKTRIILIQEVIYGRDDADAFDPRLVLIGFDAELTLACFTYRAQ